MSKKAYKQAYSRVRDVLIELDPMILIRVGAPPDEYDPEVSLLVPLLFKCTTLMDVEAAVEKVFDEAFGKSGPEPEVLLDVSLRLYEAVVSGEGRSDGEDMH